MKKISNKFFLKVQREITTIDNNSAQCKNLWYKKVGALKVAEDAIVVDTTKMTIEEVKEKVKEIILERRHIH